MSGAVAARNRIVTPLVAALAGIAVVGALAPGAEAQRRRPAVTRIGIQIRPQSITVGGAANISGRLQGRSPGGRPLILASAVFPFQTFTPTGAQTNSDRQARYHFRVSPRVNTRFQVISRTQRPAASGIVSLTVAQKVDVNLSDSTPRKRHNVYFSGSVTPAHPGATVYIQRQSVNTKRFRTVSRTVLVDAGPDHSDFRKKVRITRSAIYAVRVRGTTFNAQGFSPPLPLRVH
jgi:hypothetical protein